MLIWAGVKLTTAEVAAVLTALPALAGDRRRLHLQAAGPVETVAPEL